MNIEYNSVPYNLNQSKFCYNNPCSNIDNAVNRILETEPEVQSMLARKFIFPRKDFEVEQHLDERSSAEKFADVINILNTRLSPEMAALWSEICGYNIENACYYKSGMSFMKKEMEKLREEFKYEKTVEIDPSQTMPTCLNNNEHSKNCKPVGNKCIYSSKIKNTQNFSEAQNLFEFLLQNQNEHYTILNQKKNGTLILNFLLKTQIYTSFIKTCLSQLNRNNNLSMKKISKIFRICCLNPILNPKEKLVSEKTIYISNLNELNLPFGQGFCQTPSNLNKKLNQITMAKFLIDSGSDSNILAYQDFEKFKLSEKIVKSCEKISLKGSTGTIEDCFSGMVNLKLFLQAENGKFYHHMVTFYLAKPDLNIPSILGVKFLKQAKCNINFSRALSTELEMFNNSNELKIIQLRQVKSLSCNLSNSSPVNASSEEICFYLKNTQNYFLGDSEIQCKNGNLPNLDLSEFSQVLCFKNQQYAINEGDFSLKIPILTPLTESFETGEFKAQIRSVYFVCGDSCNKLFGEKNTSHAESNRVLDQSQNSRHSESQEGHIESQNRSYIPSTVYPSQLMQGQAYLSQEIDCHLEDKIPDGSNTPAQQPNKISDILRSECVGQGNPLNQGQEIPGPSQDIPGPCQDNPGPGQEIPAHKNVEYFEKNGHISEEETYLSQKIKQNFNQKFEEIDQSFFNSYLSEKSEYLDCNPPNEQEFTSNSFLSDTYSPQESITALIDKGTTDKISIDSNQPNEELQVRKTQLEHLLPEDRKRVKNLIVKYDKFWARRKHQIGTFNGFPASIDLEDDSTAFQKERKLYKNLTEGVEKTMEGLENEGVFSKSTGEHNEFCCNLNIVPKLENSEEVRLLSKADRFIAKHNPAQNACSATGYRAAFDFKTLNEKLKPTGKISLPTLAQIEQKIFNANISTIDLKNQFYSIVLEPQSRTKTNFYFNNKILMHNRLPMGLKSSPYISSCAMQYTFSDSVLKKFKENNKINLPFTRYDQFSVFYLDDILIFSEKKEFEGFDSKSLHLWCLEAILFALTEAGWIGSLKKANFLCTKFTFLGESLDTENCSSKIQPQRVRAIMQWRHPKSQAEAGSRLSCLSYYSRFIPALRLIALPIYQVIKSEKFFWNKLQAESFENLKFLVSLLISLKHHDPNQTLLITSDASQIAMNASFFNYSPESGEIELIDTQTKLFSKSEINYAPVVKESRAFMFALSHGEPYIRNNEKETWVLSDCSSLQYIERNKCYNSRAYTDSIYISSLPRVNIFYTMGRSLLLSDVLSRQYQNVYLNTEFNLSKNMAQLVPPLSQLNIPEFSKLSSENLTRFILDNPRGEVTDCWPKRFLYSQNISKTQLHDAFQNVSSEFQLLTGLLLGFNNQSVLTLPIWKQLLLSKGDVSKSLASQVLNTNNLSKLHKKIQDLNLDTKIYEEILSKYNFSDKCINAKLQTDSSNAPAILSHNTVQSDALCKCSECTSVAQNTKYSFESFKLLALKLNEIESFISSTKAILQQTCPNEIQQFSDTLKTLKCVEAKSKLKILFFQFLISTLSKNSFKFDNSENSTVTVSFLPFDINENFKINIEGNEINIYSKNSLIIDPLDSIKLDLNLTLGFSGFVDSIKLHNSDLVMLNSPIYQSKIFEMPFINLGNFTEEEVHITSGSKLMSCPLGVKSEHIILNKVLGSDLKKTQLQINNNENITNLINLSKTVKEFLSCFSKLQVCPPCHKVKNSINTFKAKESLLSLASKVNVGAGLTNQLAKGTGIKCFQNQTINISKILLGQQLLKNNNLFDNQMLKQLQSDCPILSAVVERLKNDDSKESKIYCLKNDVLYKKKVVLGNKTHFRLCLPNYICKSILKEHHNAQNNHFSTKQTCLYYNACFYSPGLENIAQEIVRKCLVCNLCKASYKSQYAGKNRTFEDSLVPGQVLCLDIAYMPTDVITKDKFVSIFCDRLTGYTCAIPLQNLTSKSVAQSLSTYLNMFPAPTICQVDGGGEYSGEFEKLCGEYNILVKTAIPRNSQTNGTAEASIRNLKNILTRACAGSGRGSKNWTKILPLALNSLNSQCPYALGSSRKQLQLSPYFNSLLPMVFVPQVFQNKYCADFLDLQLEGFRKLNSLRKQNLEKLNCRLFRPENFKIEKGMIVTESSTRNERVGINGSKQLSPSCLKLFKILEIQHDGASARAKNLKTGQIQTHAMKNLRFLDISDLITIQIDPRYAFSKELLRTSRMKHLHGQNFTDVENNEASEATDKEVEENDSDLDNVTLATDDNKNVNKTTRSGRSYGTIALKNNSAPMKTCLKKYSKNESDVSDFYTCDPAARMAMLRGIKWADELGLDIGNCRKILNGTYDSCFQQAKYSVPNKLPKKGPKKQLIKFSNEVLLKNGQNLLKLPLKMQNTTHKESFFVKILDQILPGSISLKETEQLML